MDIRMRMVIHIDNDAFELEEDFVGLLKMGKATVNVDEVEASDLLEDMEFDPKEIEATIEQFVAEL